MRPTITDIAKAAGVSRAAVSKALNDKADIAPATRERIKRLAGKMGYSFNFAARALSSRKTMTIGVVAGYPQLSPVIDRIMGIQEECEKSGYLSTISFHTGSLEKEIAHINLLRERIDGLIITPTNPSSKLVECIENLKLPLVFMSESIPECQFDVVSDDDELGGYLAYSHLLNSGRKKIAYFGNQPHIFSDQALLRGCARAAGESGIILDDSLTFWGNTEKTSIAANIEKALKTTSIDAVFCFCDIAALWSMEKLLELDIAIPDDIAVAGYDGTDFSAMARIPLTTITQPNIEIGRQAAATLLERITNQNSTAPKKIIFPPKLLIRDSTSSPACP